MKKRPDHLQKILDKRDQKFKALGFKENPDDMIAKALIKAHKNAGDNSIIHGLVK